MGSATDETARSAATPPGIACSIVRDTSDLAWAPYRSHISQEPCNLAKHVQAHAQPSTTQFPTI
eukprot:12172987-Alexandrium_andersonii.AAC.1